MIRRLAVLLVCVFLVNAAAAQEARDTADADIDRAIAAVKRYLWGQQQAGGGWPRIENYEYRYRLPSGFTTALCTFALLEGGEQVENSERMQKALEVLVGLKTERIEVRALRLMALGRAITGRKKSPCRPKFLEDLKWLATGRGVWGESGPARVGDNSSNQYAMMALWEAHAAGVEIPANLTRAAERIWVRRQRKDGGWAYADLETTDIGATARMTAAGLASMYVCRDFLSKNDKPYAHQAAMNRGWDFVNANLKKDFFQSSYTAFCVQRVGMASGRKFIGGFDWYALASAELAKPKPYGRNYTGYWGPVVRAAYELIIMARGRLPLTFNKLNHGKDTGWDTHPRDIAKFTDFMRNQFEMPMRWQVVKITDKVQTLLDAPIMLVTGKGALKLTPPQWGLLREYTLRGGTLLFVPIHSDKPFLQSAQKALKALYTPQRTQVGSHYELKKLPADHLVYRIHQKFRKGPGRLPMWGVSDGTRMVAMICEKDIACTWQRPVTAFRKAHFLFGSNLFLYATGRNKLASRMRPVFTNVAKTKPLHTVRVAWLKHGGNWRTQPYGLNYVAQKLTIENEVTLDVRPAPVEINALRGYHVAWMTGSDAFSLTDKELTSLREYVSQGGMLLVNAVGGADAFNLSAGKMLDKVFEGQPISRGYLSGESPLMNGKCGDFRGPKLNKLQRTATLRTAAPGSIPPMRGYRRGRRVLAVHVRFGMHDTLDGHAVYGAKSYMPASARDIAANVMLYALVNAKE